MLKCVFYNFWLWNIFIGYFKDISNRKVFSKEHEEKHIILYWFVSYKISLNYKLKQIYIITTFA